MTRRGVRLAGAGFASSGAIILWIICGRKMEYAHRLFDRASLFRIEGINHFCITTLRALIGRINLFYRSFSARTRSFIVPLFMACINKINHPDVFF